ncbi:TonB-dependent receptor [uncultured Sphingomonas sp.]|uniref:TonB-dependent receptor n=1 Tax=uncultured Sphingomonas sp. TaxID=158754 RepID=UPI0035CCA643
MITSAYRQRLLLGGALWALASPAIAQDVQNSGTGATNAPQSQTSTTNTAQPNATATSPADDAAAAQGRGLQDIVVTATKRETNLQSTPIAISVINSQALTDRHALTLFSLADGSVPSLRVATFEARQSALTIGIRGIVPYDQNQTARDNGVSVYLDGVALGKTQGLNAALFDIDRIEVLKGPQGTLFGRNTEGGALSLVTRAPSGVFDGRVVAGVGNYGSRNGEIHLDLPEYANLSFKFDGVYEHQDATVKNPLAGALGWNYYDRIGGRAQVRWKPFDGFTWDVAVDKARDDNTPQYSQLIDYNPRGYTVGAYGPTSATNLTPRLYLPGTSTPCGGTISTTSTTPICIAPRAPLVGIHPNRQDVADVGVPQQPSVDLTHGISSQIRFRAAPWVEFRSITAWRGVSTDQWDNSGGPERVTFSPSFPGEDITTSNSGKFSRYSLSFLRQHQFSQELQAVGSVPHLDYVLGAYYYTESAQEYAATPSSNLWNATGTAYTILSPIPPATTLTGATAPISSTNQGWQPGFTPTCINGAIAGLCQFVTRDSTAHDHNYSVFGQATYTPAGLDLVHITAGGRWTKDDRHGALFIINNRTDLNPIAAVANSVRTPFLFQNSISRFDPLVTLAVDAAPTVHLYAKYATGFRAGGADDRSDTFRAFGPESVKSYEIGAKMDFFDHMARLNLAGYIMDRKNTQFDFDYYDTSSTSPTFNSHLEEAINAGTSHIKGIEADLTVKPAPSLTLGGSYAYTHWTAPQAVNPIFGGPPQQLYIVYTPTNAASGSIDWALPIQTDFAKVRLHLDANYSSSYYSFELEPTKTDSSFVVNGRLALADIKVNDNDRVTLSAWVRNMFDEQYIYRRSNANSSPVQNYCGANGLNGTTPCTANALISNNYGGILGDYANFNPPRTFGLEVAAKF